MYCAIALYEYFVLFIIQGLLCGIMLVIMCILSCTYLLRMYVHHGLCIQKMRCIWWMKMNEMSTCLTFQEAFDEGHTTSLVVLDSLTRWGPKQGISSVSYLKVAFCCIPWLSKPSFACFPSTECHSLQYCPMPSLVLTFNSIHPLPPSSLLPPSLSPTVWILLSTCWIGLVWSLSSVSVQFKSQGRVPQW